MGLIISGMNRDQLLMAISKPLLKDRIIQLASGDSCHVSDLILLSSYPVGEIAFRASRILEYVLYFQPEQFIPYVSDSIYIPCRKIIVVSAISQRS